MPTEKQLANLKPLKKGLPKSDQREIQRKGSKAGVQKRKEYASLKEAAKDKITFDEAMDVLIKRMKAGNLKAWEIYYEVTGEKVSKVEQTNVEESVKFDE